MGAVVQYRDLPGGPTKLRLCDELSRHCMCTNCGMLSMSMLQDQNRHMFCETCLMERSIKYNSEHIYCSYENQQVDIFKMFDASDLITVIRDQFAECPNPECNKHVTLQELKEHYTKCKPAVMCSTCQQQVQSADWSDHSKNCNKQEAGRAQSMGARPKQFGPKQAVPSPKSSTSVKINSNQNSQQTFSPLYPSSELQEAQISTNDGPEKMTLCPHCERRLKERNLDRHFKACSKVPQSCCYCDGKFIAEEIKSHVAVCEKNPDRVLKQKPEKREAVNTQVVSGSQVSRGGQPTYASALKNGKPAEGNNSTITKPQPKGPPRKECAQVGHPAAKGASKSCPDPQRHKVPADSPIWLQLMSSGNLLAAFAAFEESCSEKKMSEELIYSQFTTRFVDTKYREMVKDLLEKPCPTQPLYCLMVALFTRACLPPNVWAKSEDKVTWKDVLKYLPSILVSRLKKRDVIAYLQTYPIFLDKEETSPIVEAHCSTKEHPSNTSHSSNSTHLAAPTKVADPLGTGKDGHDSSEMPQDISMDSAKREDERGDVRAKGNHSDGGDPPGEELPALQTGEKAAIQKPPANVEAKLPDKRKCNDSENGPKKEFENVVTKTGPPLGSDAEYTPKEAASEPMQAATDQAGARAMPTAPSCEDDTIAGEESVLKAENASTSVGDSDLKECSELSPGLQSENNSRVNTPRKDSNISTSLDNLSSAAEGPVQTDSFSAAAFSPTGAEVSHEKPICSTEHTTPSTRNEPAFMGKPETRDGHPKGIVHENFTNGAKFRTYQSESTSSSGSNESGHLEGTTKIAIKAPGDRNTISSIGDRFPRESSAVSAPNRQFENKQGPNVAFTVWGSSTRLKASFNLHTKGTMQKVGFSNADHVSQVKADALPLQRIDSTEHDTASTKQERSQGLLRQARLARTISRVTDSPVLTGNDGPQHCGDEDAKTRSARAFTATFEATSSEQPSLERNLSARQEMATSKTEQHIPSGIQDLEGILPQLSQLKFWH